VRWTGAAVLPVRDPKRRNGARTLSTPGRTAAIPGDTRGSTRCAWSRRGRSSFQPSPFPGHRRTCTGRGVGRWNLGPRCTVVRICSWRGPARTLVV